MSDPASVSNSQPAAVPKARRRVVEYLIILIVMGIVILAAFYQEQVSTFFALKLWDKGAPGRTVTEFLSAGKKGDQTLATSYLGSNEFKPLMKDGKWQGYFIVSQAGTMEFHMNELAPAAASTVSNTDFFPVGQYAEVKVPDSSGKDVKYRLEMKDGWKITEILGGRPANSAAPKNDAPKKTITAPK